MAKEIIVLDTQGNMLEATYAKRAAGLVKAGRADWVDESTICILNMEEKNMDNSSNEYANQGNGPLPQQGAPFMQHREADMGYGYEMGPFAGYSDEELLKLAKKRVKERNALVVHAVSYIVVNIFLFFVAIFGRGGLWNFYVLGGWGIGLACHVASYFFSTRPETIHAEYMKLKGGRYR